MNIQDTIVELFEAKRIDKATAYRLLAEAKKTGPSAPEAPKSLTLSFDFQLGNTADPELKAIATWSYLLYVITGKTELCIDYITPLKTSPLQLTIGSQISFDQLLQSLVSQLDQSPAAGYEPFPWAWVAANANDPVKKRLMRISCGTASDTATALLPLKIEADLSLQGATIAEDWPETFQHLYDTMTADSGRWFEQLDLLPLRHRILLHEYNSTWHYLPPLPTVAALLDPMLAKADNEKVVVMATKGQQNYGQYKQHAYRIAHLLRYLGAERHDRVAIIAERTVKVPATLYGIICSGAAYVPVEPDAPWARMCTIIKTGGIKIMVTDASTLYADQLKLDQTDIKHIVCLDRWPRKTFQGIPVWDKKAIEACNDTPPNLVNQPGDPAYILFTSGSTGTPKGVEVSNLNLVNSLIGLNDKFNLNQFDRFMMFSSFAFDLSVFDAFAPILAGGSMFLTTKMEIRDPNAMLDILRNYKLTVWDSVPTGLQQLLLSFNDKNVVPVESLRLALLGGEAILPNLPGDLLRLFPNCRLSNLGGATEVTIYSNYYYPVPRFEPHWKSIPYGRPLPNQRMYVLNDALKPCSIGEKGMIYFGGLSVTSGYHGDPEKTRTAFIPAPWPDEPGGFIYRSGDLGIMHADAQMEFCGRADHQIKIRGFRVELGEIEQKMQLIPTIMHVAVIPKQESNGQTRLVGFYATTGDEISSTVFETELRKHLPEYMVPSQFVHLTDPPVGTTGKLDRKALANHNLHHNDTGPDYTQPTGELEQKLATELARILKLERVGIDDDFFLIGGDSLISLQYLALLSDLGLKANPVDIQQGRTIRGVLERALLNKENDAGHESIDGIIPPSPMARRFFERLPIDDRNHWNQMMVIGYDHEPDIELLNEAMKQVFQNHAVLRATYQHGKMCAETRPPFELTVIDSSNTLFIMRPFVFKKIVADIHATVGIKGQPVANAALVLFGPNDARLIWVLHQTVVDANCWRILVEDLSRAYQQPSTPLLRSATYTNHIVMVDKNVPQAIVELGKKPQYARMKVPRKVPFGEPGASNTEGEGITLFRRLSVPETTRILDVIRPGVVANLNFLMLTSLALTLKQWSGESTVRFDVISNGRSVDPTHDYSRTVGWFATHNPFEIVVPDDETALLPRILEAWQVYQEYSPMFVEVGNRVRGDSTHPLGKQVDQPLLYSHLGDFDSLNMPVGWSVRGSGGGNRGSNNTRTHDLEFETMIVGGILMLRLVYGPNLFSRQQANSLIDTFKKSTLHLVSHLEKSIPKT